MSSFDRGGMTVACRNGWISINDVPPDALTNALVLLAPDATSAFIVDTDD
ncbi:hypothetical protein [Pandoraea sp. SD6-2]|nr:hypothetical protein [Pandoraea sp. SD6-2]